ncbi:hypothetical protein GOP47_0006306 [Adiantum capillus-veneris]|uniref:Uncharacterized protein n=1 Tax=Adiantum capillus-veneris TaxID=13818 RepID=A0A9D4V366_ADICA|nr:hypothetical protein GOP47_0006306 [Adiantum capillus-veneris]
MNFMNTHALVSSHLQDELASKITRAAYCMVKGDHKFRGWLKREGSLQRILDKSKKILVDYVDVPGEIDIPPSCTMDMFYTEIVVEGRKFLFPLEVALENKTKDVE